MPLSSSVLVSRQELLELIEGMREVLPEELKQARWVVKDREETLEKARREAEDILAQARTERSRLVSKTEVIRAANREADRIVEEAKESARQMRLEVEDYVDSKLANFEVVLQKTLAAVERGRERLRGRLDADRLTEPEGEETEGVEEAEREL
jgi:F0F1-type ATP synthase membrane subunit b/b'